MADEHNHLLDAAAALDAKVGRKPTQSARIGDADELPEDATEVPDNRDVAAIRSGLAGTQSESE